jgi:predicted nucleic acid-binding protein
VTTFFVDANILVYSRSSSPSGYRDPCLEILTAIERDEVDAQISTAVLEEIWNLELTDRVEGINGLAADARELFSPVLPITEGIFARALALAHSKIGAKDRVHVATCLEHGIDRIVSADKGFDSVAGLLRIDPREGVAPLLNTEPE